jgi:hypothetical protein
VDPFLCRKSKHLLLELGCGVLGVRTHRRDEEALAGWEKDRETVEEDRNGAAGAVPVLGHRVLPD